MDIWIPLLNFYIEGDPPDIALERAQLVLVQIAVNPSDNTIYLCESEIASDTCLYCVKMQLSGISDEEARIELDNILAILKLFKEGYFIATDILGTDQQQNIIIVDNLSFCTSWSTYYDQQLYEVKIAELERFIEFWRTFRVINGRHFAVRRFVRAEFKPQMDDGFVDYVMALDCLLVPDSDEFDIKNKFVKRGASILKTIGYIEAETKIQCVLHNAYDIRSKIVHGDEDEIKIPTGTTAEIFWKDKIVPIRKYIRDIIVYLYRENLLQNVEGRTAFMKKIYDKKQKLKKCLCRDDSYLRVPL